LEWLKTQNILQILKIKSKGKDLLKKNFSYKPRKKSPNPVRQTKQNKHAHKKKMIEKQFHARIKNEALFE